MNCAKAFVISFLFFVNYSLAMEKDPIQINKSKELPYEKINLQPPLLIDQCSKAIADRLAADLIAQRDYSNWFDFEYIPKELQDNILKALCKYHSNIVWQYLSDSISVISLTDNVIGRCSSHHIGISSDGGFIFSNFANSFGAIWDAKTLKCLLETENTQAIETSPDSKFIAIVSKDQTVQIWKIKKLKLLPISFKNGDMSPPDIRVSSAIAITSNKLIATNHCDLIRIENIETGDCLNTLKTDLPRINWILMDTINDQLIVIGNKVQSGNIKCNQSFNTIYEEMYTTSLTFNDKLLVIYGTDIRSNNWFSKLAVLHRITGSCLFEKEVNNIIHAVAISPKGTLLAFSRDEKLEILNKKGKQYLILSGHEQDIQTIAVSSDKNIVVTGAADNTIKIWAVKIYKCINSFKSAENYKKHNHSSYALSVAISQNNDFIAAGLYDGVVKVWKIDTNKGLKAILEEIKKNINQKK